MADDWETFSASPYQQESSSPVEPLDAEDFLHLSMGYLRTTGWIDDGAVIAQTLLGGKQVWFDYLYAIRIGMTGAQIENTLGSKGITVRAKSIISVEGGLAAVVVVGADKEQTTRELFAKWGILL